MPITPRESAIPTWLERIVSGGQTGVDRAALDVALDLGIACGGWCPKDRLAEDGRVNDRYPLAETPSPDYVQRTEWNVRDSEGTLILNRGPLEGGTAFTVQVAARLLRPCWIVDMTRPLDVAASRAWMVEHRIHVLNVAGPRESRSPGIHEQAVRVLRALLVHDTLASHPERDAS